MDMSIILVSYNTRDLLDLCLKELYEELDRIKGVYSSFEFEVILVDNGSKDGTKELVDEKYKDVVGIYTGKNLGFAAGNNVGFERARGRYIVLLNTDAFFTEGSLLKAYDLMDSYRDVSIGLARLIDRDGGDQPSRRAFPGVINDFLKYSGLEAKFPTNKFFSRGEYGYLNRDEEGICHWGPGAFSIIREQDLYKIGYFDEDYFMYYEEVDLALRFARHGYLSYYFPQVKVVHLGGESAKGIKDRSISKVGSQLLLWSYQSKYIYFRKNYGYIKAYLIYKLEVAFRLLQYLKNRNKEKGQEVKEYVDTMQEAWVSTKSGSISPEKPWR